MKYYTVRLLAALFVMGSFDVGFLAGAEYSKWIGWVVFIIIMLIGVKLHYVAEKIDKHHK